MKTLYTLLLAALGLNVANAKITSLSSDTIQRKISILQADSLIRADKTNLDFHILDVRQPDEFKTGFIPSAENVDFFAPNFSAIIDTFDKDKIYLLYCKAGSRSGNAYNLMKNKKFRILYCMDGGIEAWKDAGFPLSLITYAGLELANQNQIMINPIFAKDYITINIGSSNSICDLLVYDCSGKVILQSKLFTSIATINISNLQNGLYFVKVKNNNKVELKRFFKQ